MDEKQMPPPYKNNQYYVGGTNDKTRKYDDYPSDTDGCEINMDGKHKINNMKNTLNLYLKKMIELNQKPVKG